MGLTLPPPTVTPTRLRPGDDGAWIGPGDLSIAGGIGITARAATLTDGLIFDGQAIDKDAPAGLFVPDVSSWPTTTLAIPSGRTRLTYLELLIAGTTPGAADASNYWRLNVQGATDGLMQLAMSDSVRRFAFDGLTPVLIADNPDGGSAWSDTPATTYAQPFVPLSDLNVSSVSHIRNGNGSASSAWGTRRRWALLDADRNLMAWTEWNDTDYTGLTDRVRLTLALTSTQELKQGTTYYFAAQFEDGTVAQYIARGASSGSETGVEAPDTTKLLGRTDIYDPTQLDPATDLLRPGDEVLRGATFGLHGSPSGVIIDGATMDISFDTVGTPPADPTNVNMRMQWSGDA